MSDEDVLLPDTTLPFGSGIIGICDVCRKRQAVIVLQKERFQLCVLDFLNKAWIGSKAPPGRPLPPYRSERIWFETEASPSGKAPAVVLSPTRAVRRPAVLVTPDIYGLTTLLLDGGVRFAREGFEVFLPDLGKYDALSPLDHLALRRELHFGGGVQIGSPRVRRLVALYRDALRALRSRTLVDPEKVALFGASYGGSLALALAGEETNIAALALAFPCPIRPAEYLRLLHVPVGFFAGESDPRARRARLQLEQHLAAEPAARFGSYPGMRHLFLARDLRPYDLPSAERAWSDILAFLRERLLPPPPRPPAPPVVHAAPPAKAPAAPAAPPPPVTAGASAPA